MEDINDADYRHLKRVFKIFNNKSIGDYHNDAILLGDVFENFRNTCLKEYELDPDYFLSLPGLAWLACLKIT